MRVDELAESLRTALRNLPAKLRPDDRDIGVMAQLMAQEPCMARWWPDERDMDFRKLNPP